MTDEQPVRMRPVMTYFWWQRERTEQQRREDVLAERRAQKTDAPTEQLPAAG